MNALLRLLDNGDGCSMLVAAILLYVVGSRVANERQTTIARSAGLIVFLVYAASVWLRQVPDTGQFLLDLVVRALLAAGLAYGFGLVALPVVGTLVERLVESPCRAIRNQWNDRRRSEQEEQEREIAQRRADEERARATREEPARRAAAERARAAAAEHQRVADDARQRREQSRSECLLFYHLHAPEIGGRFPRDRYDEFATRYLQDNLSPDEVERQASRLMGVMEGHLEKTGKSRRTTDVLGYSRWYAEEKSKIETQDIPEDIRATHLAILEARYGELVEKYLEGLRP